MFLKKGQQINEIFLYRPSGFYSDIGSQNGPHDSNGPKHFPGPCSNDGPPRFPGNEGPSRFSGHSGSDSECPPHMQGPANEGLRFPNPGDGPRYNGPCPDGPRFSGSGPSGPQRQSGPADAPPRFNGPAPGPDGPPRFNAPGSMDIPPRYNGPCPDGPRFQNPDGPPRFAPRGPGQNIGGPAFGPGPRFGAGPGFNQGPGPNFVQPLGQQTFAVPPQRGPGPMGFNNPAAPVLNMLGAILSQAPPELIQSALAPRLMAQQGKEPPPPEDHPEARGLLGLKPSPDPSLEHRQMPPVDVDMREPMRARPSEQIDTEGPSKESPHHAGEYRDVMNKEPALPTGNPRSSIVDSLDPRARKPSQKPQEPEIEKADQEKKTAQESNGRFVLLFIF